MRVSELAMTFNGLQSIGYGPRLDRAPHQQLSMPMVSVGRHAVNGGESMLHLYASREYQSSETNSIQRVKAVYQYRENEYEQAYKQRCKE